ncbi:MAG: C-type lectin domain-containing protein [Polyangiaceae bacterium]
MTLLKSLKVWCSLVASVTFLAMGCSSSPTGNSEEAVGHTDQALLQQFSVKTLNGDPRSTLLSATDAIVTADDRVVLGDGVAPETISAFGAAQTQVGAGAIVRGNVTAVGPVQVRSQATVTGFVRSGAGITTQPPVTISGGQFQNAAVTGVPTTWTVDFPATNAGDVILQPDTTRTLAPGSWKALNVNARAKLFLSSGTYFFDSYNTEPNAQIFLNRAAGPIFIYVRTTFTHKAVFVSNGGLDGETLFSVLGSSNVVFGSALLGTVVAPNATIELQRSSDNKPHRGAAFGKQIQVFSNITVLHLPFSWTFTCPLGDSDGDGTNDCIDACIKDPLKIDPGICGCGQLETDIDHDGIPKCIDTCDNDVNNSSEGQCGCPPTATPAGTPCTDSVCPIPAGGATCNGSGVCGNPNSCAPAPTGCRLRHFGDKNYWFCDGPVSWTQAAQNCRAVPNRKLVRISSRIENAFVSGVLTTKSWLGANDQSVEGTWRWSSPASNNDDPFWNGGPAGSVVAKRFQKWQGGQPVDVNDCGAIQTGAALGTWTAEACTGTFGYVCEQPEAFTPPYIPPIECGKFFPALACGPEPKQSPKCVAASTVLPPTEQEAEDQIKACNQANLDGKCTETDQSGCDACKGAASVPPPGSCPPFDAEEQATCELTNVVETGCTAGTDCCTLVETAVISEKFETNTGSFTYLDDAFLATAQPNFASGQRVTSGGNSGAALQVTLGGINNNLVTNMSGGWRSTFTLSQEQLVVLSFDYNLSQSPNYEANEQSQVLLSLDGQLKGRPFDTFADQIVGNGDGGANITTGFRPFVINLGRLAAGSHTLTIGGFNSQKDNSNESTTILIDNVDLRSRADTCGAGFICGPVQPGDCNSCDEKDANDVCTKVCPPAALRCGQPTPKCANNAPFGNDRCQQIEICADPNATGNSDPTVGGGLVPKTFDPGSAFGPATTPAPTYFSDPACASPPCSSGKANRWCHYNVKVWEDPAVPGAPQNPVPNKNPPPAANHGSSGGDLLTFSFDPNVSLSYNLDPLPFGESKFNLDTSASFSSTVGFNLGPAHGTTKIIDALVALHADRCSATTAQSKIMLFGEDFFPSTLKINESVPGCDTAITTYVDAVSRVKKAYKDALELVRQYNLAKLNGTSLPTDLCQQLLSDPPKGFPGGSCTGVNAAATINRFIQFYESELTRVLQPAADTLAGSVLTLPGKTLRMGGSPSRETQTLLEATFPIGPIPLRLEIEAFVEYGLGGELVFTLNPGAFLVGTGQRETLANIEGHATPYALSGVGLFVGVGFGFNGFSISAGVQGDITLGRIALDAFAGAGIGIRATSDDRELPKEVKDAADVGVADTKMTLFPPGGAKKYEFSLLYHYGSDVVLSQILQGSIAGRVRIKIAFFSKTWRKVLLTFPGFGPIEIPLLNGGGSSPALSIDGVDWGAVQMPLPFVKLARLDTTTPLPGPSVPLSTANVEKLFYDTLCDCKADTEPCFTTSNCCGAPTSTCYKDPEQGGQQVCRECGKGNESCNTTKDCCGTANRFCEDNPHDTKSVTVCRLCRDNIEPCTEDLDCCSGFCRGNVTEGFFCGKNPT